jgi:hypothetical protein
MPMPRVVLVPEDEENTFINGELARQLAAGSTRRWFFFRKSMPKMGN